MVIFISIFNREKNLLCIFYQLFEHVEILYSKNFSGYFTQPTAFTINTHLYFDKINVLQVCILTVESYSMGYLEMIVRRSGIIVVIICQTINGAEIISISPFITIIYPISTITGLIVITLFQASTSQSILFFLYPGGIIIILPVKSTQIINRPTLTMIVCPWGGKLNTSWFMIGDGLVLPGFGFPIFGSIFVLHYPYNSRF